MCVYIYIYIYIYYVYIIMYTYVYIYIYIYIYIYTYIYIYIYMGKRAGGLSQASGGERDSRPACVLRAFLARALVVVLVADVLRVTSRLRTGPCLNRERAVAALDQGWQENACAYNQNTN